MYKQIIRPLLFSIDPERVHHWVFAWIKLGFSIPGARWLIRSITTVKHPLLKRQLLGMTFENPVGIAAGLDKNAVIYNELGDMGFGFVEIGTVTPLGQPGNPKKRLFRLPADHGLINRMGFNNHGLNAAVGQLRKRRTKAVIGGNLGKNTLTPNERAVADYVTLFDGLSDHVDYVVVNVSCPNISDLRELQDQKALVQILEAIKERNSLRHKPLPVLLKVSPDLNNGQLDEVIELAGRGLMDGVVAVNTTITRNGLSTPMSRVEQIGKGGLSGMPVKARATEVIRYLSEKSGKAFPIIGVGGIETPEDAIEKLEAGADLLQVYTGFIYQGPSIARRINKALVSYYKNKQHGL